MSSLNQEVDAANIIAGNPASAAATAATASAVASALEDTNDPENPAAPGGRAISRRGEEARGGFVLRAKSDETPHRRRSLVERSGMKTLVQVSKSSFFFYIFSQSYSFLLLSYPWPLENFEKLVWQPIVNLLKASVAANSKSLKNWCGI